VGLCQDTSQLGPLRWEMGGSQTVDVLEVVPAVTRSNRAVWHDGDWQPRGERALIWGCFPSDLKADTRPGLHLLSG